MYTLKMRLGELQRTLTIISDGKNITNIVFDADFFDNPDKLCEKAKLELCEYFCGIRKKFSVPYMLSGGSDFFLKVMAETEKIPYGTASSYKEIAINTGTGAVRATGSALKKNPLPILIPCHRILCSDGTAGHYMGGAGDDIKKYLLDIEGIQYK